MIHDRRSFHAVILSGVPAKNFRPTSFAGRAGAESKESAVAAFFYDVGHGEKQVPRLGPASASSQKQA